MKIPTQIIIEINKPDEYGRVWSDKAAEELIRQFEYKRSVLGHSYGELGHNESDIFELWNASHDVIEIAKIDNCVVADVETIPGSKGELLSKLYNLGLIEFKPKCLGNIGPDGEIINLTLVSIDAIPKNSNTKK
jgi:hypothetical protein